MSGAVEAVDLTGGLAGFVTAPGFGQGALVGERVVMRLSTAERGS